MARKYLSITFGVLLGLTTLGYLLYWISPGWKESIDWRGIVFEALLFLFVFSWNLAVLPHWKSTKILCLGSLIFLAGSFTDVHDEFFHQPRWVNILIEDPSLALGAGLIGLGIWFWVKEKGRLLSQLERERDFEASLIPKLSHDLRVPLTNLSGVAALAEDEPQLLEDPKWRHELFEIVWRAVKEMSLMIDNILETHRLKSGAVELNPRTIALSPLLDETCKDFQYQTKQKRITIVKDLSDEEVILDGDPAKIVRIIQNLLANAVKFSPKGAKIKLKADAQNGEIVVRVIDEGPGIPMDQIEMIMQGIPPPRAAKGTQGGSGSFGIGLKVVREFVHLHGGRFWIEPNIPEGTQFCFTLPRRGQQGRKE